LPRTPGAVGRVKAWRYRLYYDSRRYYSNFLNAHQPNGRDTVIIAILGRFLLRIIAVGSASIIVNHTVISDQKEQRVPQEPLPLPVEMLLRSWCDRIIQNGLAFAHSDVNRNALRITDELKLIFKTLIRGGFFFFFYAECCWYDQLVQL
jgi:hypothetical protein